MVVPMRRKLLPDLRSERRMPYPTTPLAPETRTVFISGLRSAAGRPRSSYPGGSRSPRPSSDIFRLRHDAARKLRIIDAQLAKRFDDVRAQIQGNELPGGDRLQVDSFNALHLVT